MNYLVVESNEAAVAVSGLLFALSRPPQVKAPDDRTSALLALLPKPDGTAWALAIPDDARIPLHPERDPSQLIEFFKPFISESEAAIFEFLAGETLTIDLAKIVPQALKERLKTQAEMDAEGWFQTIEPGNPVNKKPARAKRVG